jgi:hypothetical protein
MKMRLSSGLYTVLQPRRQSSSRILNIPENVNSNEVSPSPDAVILKQLKEKFQDSVTS